MADNIDLMDFTPRKAAIAFKLYDEVYYACTDLPLGMMQKLSSFRTLVTSTSDGEEVVDMEPMLRLFDELLLDDSAARFRAGMTNKEKLIGVGVVTRVIPWLMEEYGLRPTQPSDPSSTGLPDEETGTPSTDGV